MEMHSSNPSTTNVQRIDFVSALKSFYNFVGVEDVTLRLLYAVKTISSAPIFDKNHRITRASHDRRIA